MKQLVIFTSPTCGPCQLFKPQVKLAASDLGLEYIEYDVSTPDGLAEAKKYGIQSSGQALYLIDNEVKYKWERPCAAVAIKNDIGTIA